MMPTLRTLAAAFALLFLADPCDAQTFGYHSPAYPSWTHAGVGSTHVPNSPVVVHSFPTSSWTSPVQQVWRPSGFSTPYPNALTSAVGGIAMPSVNTPVAQWSQPNIVGARQYATGGAYTQPQVPITAFRPIMATQVPPMIQQPQGYDPGAFGPGYRSVPQTRTSSSRTDVEDHLIQMKAHLGVGLSPSEFVKLKYSGLTIPASTFVQR